MSDRYPFGANTLIIPFTMVGGSISPRRWFGMSRMRPAGQLFRYGVVKSVRRGDEHEEAAVTTNLGSTGASTSASVLDVTPFGAPIIPSSPDPYATTDVGGITVRLGTVTTPGTSQPPATPHEARLAQAVSYFQSQGWSREQAIGLVANLDAESGLDPNRHQSGGGPGYGLGQWEQPRQHDFEAWAGHDIHNSTFEEQLQFVQHELTSTQSTAGAALRRATTAESAARTVTRRYERPRDTEGEATRRAERAMQIESRIGR